MECGFALEAIKKGELNAEQEKVFHIGKPGMIVLCMHTVGNN